MLLVALNFGRSLMTRPEGISNKHDVSGDCDLCNNQMPPSGGFVTSRALKRLVEDGFDLIPTSGPVGFIMRLMELQGMSRGASSASMKGKILNEQMGDFGVCPDCFRRIEVFCA